MTMGTFKPLLISRLERNPSHPISTGYVSAVTEGFQRGDHFHKRSPQSVWMVILSMSIDHEDWAFSDTRGD